MQETWDMGLIPGSEDRLEEGMATHSSILTWNIPWIEEPGGLQSIGLQRVGHDWTDLARMHKQLNIFTPISLQKGSKVKTMVAAHSSRVLVHLVCWMDIQMLL